MSGSTRYTRRGFAGAAAMTLAMGHSGLIRAATNRLPIEGEMPSLAGATGWLNTEPLTANGLRGKVVLVDFCTYTCINWLRSLPYVRAWSKKYRAHGLVVIGVHTPEFQFERDIENIRQGLKDTNIDYAVAVDSNYAIWRAFQNAYWPALYFVDAKGRIRHHRFGEGDYARSERVIQQLLSDAGQGSVGPELVSVNASGVEAGADWDNLRSSENYLGYERTQNFRSPGGAKLDKPRSYAAPAQLRLNEWALSGGWTITRPSTVMNTAGGRLVYRFHARDLHLVMGAAKRGSAIRFRILLDGKPPEEARGLDVDANGNGAVSLPRMYQLIRQPKPIVDRQFEIEFLDPGAEIYSVTFG